MTRFITILLSLVLIVSAFGIKGCKNKEKSEDEIQEASVSQESSFNPLISKEEAENQVETVGTEEEEPQEEPTEEENTEDEEAEEGREDSAFELDSDSIFAIYNGYGGPSPDFSSQEEIEYALSLNSVESDFWEKEVKVPVEETQEKTKKTKATKSVTPKEVLVASNDTGAIIVNGRSQQELFDEVKEQLQKELEEKEINEKEEIKKEVIEAKEVTKEIEEPEIPKAVSQTFHAKAYVYDNALNFSQRTIPSGPVSFSITNYGRFSHIFTIGGTGTSIKVLPGKTVTINTTLTSGVYQVYSDKSLEENIEFIGEYSEKRQQQERKIASSITVQ